MTVARGERVQNILRRLFGERCGVEHISGRACCTRRERHQGQHHDAALEVWWW